MATIDLNHETICINPTDDLTLFDKNHTMSRIEKFLFAICSLDSSDLPIPLSRIEELYNCLVTGDTPPTFEPLSRAEKFLMACLGAYDINKLPEPLSRSEILLKKIATGDSNLEDVDNLQSKYEFLLAYIIQNGGVDGDISYMKYTLTEKETTLYNTKKRSVRSAILCGSTKYKDVDTDEILETFEEGRNLELVSVKMPVLTTTGKNLFDDGQAPEQSYWGDNIRKVNVKENTHYVYSSSPYTGPVTIKFYDINGNETRPEYGYASGEAFYTPSNTSYIKIHTSKTSLVQIEEGLVATEYEPCKSNILKVNEEVTLRGIGNVKDELNLLTGKVTERIGEVILNGSENWICNTINDTTINLYCNGFGSQPTSLVICDKLKSETYDGIRTSTVGGFSVSLDKNITGVNDVNTFKNWLQNNNLTVVYLLKTEVIKTVDLSIVDQDGNDTKLNTFNDITYVTLSSEGIIPEAELGVATKNEEVLNTLSLEMDDIL